MISGCRSSGIRRAVVTRCQVELRYVKTLGLTLADEKKSSAIRIID
jgi:hypothetical protein